MEKLPQNPDGISGIDGAARKRQNIREKAEKIIVPVEAIPAAVEQQDMLTFLQRLPDKSVSIFSSGIDSTIIKDGKYAQAVNTEIARVIHPQGCFVGYASKIYPSRGKYESKPFFEAFEEGSPVYRQVSRMDGSELQKFKPKDEAID